MSIANAVVAGTPGRELETHTLTPALVPRNGFSAGMQMIMADGRKFRYAIIPTGGTTLVRGNWLQAQANTANHIGLTPTAAAIGDRTVTVTLGATAALANEYKGGYLHLNQGTAGGTYYLIKEHPAAAASGTLALTLEVAVTGLAIPATAASADLIHNKYWNPIQGLATKTQTPVGVAMSTLAAGQGGWVQTAGPCSVLTQGTTVVGNFVVTSTSVAGAVAPSGAAGAATENQVGVTMRVGGNGAWSLIDLKLDN